MENFFIPQGKKREINEVKHGTENFSLSCSLKLFFSFSISLRRKTWTSSEGMGKKQATLNWFNFKWTPENFAPDRFYLISNMSWSHSRWWFEAKRTMEVCTTERLIQIWFCVLANYLLTEGLTTLVTSDKFIKFSLKCFEATEKEISFDEFFRMLLSTYIMTSVVYMLATRALIAACVCT